MNKFIKIIKKQIKLQKLSYLQLRELEWANIYHDSIRGKKALQNLPLNIGRWAGNYAFFYLLNRVLTDFKLQSILEFGLGESTKFVSTFNQNYATNTKHVVIEHNKNWKTLFTQKFQLHVNSEIKQFNLVQEIQNKKTYNSYQNISNVINNTFDLYIIDGPIGTPNYSRFDIVKLAEKFNKNDEFIILIDDYERPGEKETASVLLKILDAVGITYTEKEFVGNKSVLVIATEKYKYITTV